MTFEQTLERSEGLSCVAIWGRRVLSRGKSSEPEGGEAEGACLGHLWEGSGSGWSSKNEQRRMSGKEVSKVWVCSGKVICHPSALSNSLNWPGSSYMLFTPRF